jgi:hypothetical protein
LKVRAFADYFNRYAESIKPAGGNPAFLEGIAKTLKQIHMIFLWRKLITLPQASISIYSWVTEEFIGDGYRSLLESDGASPYPYFKINTNFGK